MSDKAKTPVVDLTEMEKRKISRGQLSNLSRLVIQLAYKRDENKVLTKVDTEEAAAYREWMDNEAKEELRTNERRRSALANKYCLKHKGGAIKRDPKTGLQEFGEKEQNLFDEAFYKLMDEKIELEIPKGIAKYL